MNTIIQKTDTQLHADVVAELEFEPSVHMQNIAVVARNGIVYLTGSVPNYMEKWNAERAVKRVRGVLGVTDELTVNFLPGLIHTDPEIMAAAQNAIEWRMIAAEKPIEVQVEHRIVTLKGQVAWQYQKEDAYAAVAHLRGVKSVVNLISLKPQIVPADIRAKIESAFERSAELDATNIRIALDGSCVTLSGTLPTWRELEAATRAAWNTKGVTAVTNDILIV